jgi:hypothetical protein
MVASLCDNSEVATGEGLFMTFRLVISLRQANGVMCRKLLA